MATTLSTASTTSAPTRSTSMPSPITSTDPVGNTTRILDAEGHATYFVYDAVDRLVQINGPGDLRAQFAYDAAGNLIAATGGHPTYRYGQVVS